VNDSVISVALTLAYHGLYLSNSNFFTRSLCKIKVYTTHNEQKECLRTSTLKNSVEKPSLPPPMMRRMMIRLHFVFSYANNFAFSERMPSLPRETGPLCRAQVTSWRLLFKSKPRCKTGCRQQTRPGRHLLSTPVCTRRPARGDRQPLWEGYRNKACYVPKGKGKSTRDILWYYFFSLKITDWIKSPTVYIYIYIYIFIYLFCIILFLLFLLLFGNLRREGNTCHVGVIGPLINLLPIKSTHLLCSPIGNVMTTFLTNPQ